LLPVYAIVAALIYAGQSKHGERWRAFVELALRPVPLLGTARHYLALARLAAIGVPRTFHDGQSLFVEGDAASQVFILRTGAARLTRMLPCGTEFLLDVVPPGGVVGLESLHVRERNATASACGELSCSAVTADAARELLLARPELSLALLRIAHSGIDELRSRYVDITASQAQHRVARFLLNTLPVWRSNMPRFTQLDIAQALGLTPETVSRVLSRFRQKRWILGRSRTLKVADAAALERVARKGFAAPSVSSRLP
ncbi:MAG: Crp/Fnr family transcriptional regulator, partial [Deltaproteobacteria bacterium]